MASVRYQIFDAVEDKLELVRDALDWALVLRDPRVPVGEDQMNALVLGTGGDMVPGSLTGHVATHELEFSVGLIVLETESDCAEALLDAGFVAVSNALLDPLDIQLGGLAVDIRRGAMSPPIIGTAKAGARIVGVQEIEFTVNYWAREGDAELPGP